MACPATDVAVADTATKGATDAAVGATAADVGATSLGGTAALDAGTALAAGEGGALATGAGLGAADALSGGSTAVLPEITVTGTAPAAAGGSSAFLPAAAGAAGIAGGLAGAGASPSVSAQPATADTGSSFLTATGPSDVQSLDPGMASTLGVDTGTADQGFIGLAGDTSPLPGDVADVPSGYTLPDSAAPDQGGGFMDWLKNPKNAATAGLLGISGMNALFGPKLPGAAKTALGAAGPAVQQATTAIQTGGQGSPLWPGMKASIDATIDQQIEQAKQSIMQAAANSGMQGPGVPTGVTSEQIAKMTSDLNVQRQQLYEQALNQIVQQAVQELTGSNQVLMSVAQLELAQDQEARQQAAETAQLALELQSFFPT